MNPKNTTEVESVLTAFEDVLADLAEELGELPAACKECKVYDVLSKFALKLRKAKLHEEARIVRKIRDEYNI